MMRYPIRPVVALVTLLPLAACISFGGKPPRTLMTLTTAVPLPVNETSSSRKSPTITIQVPSVPQALASARVPVQTGATSIAYVKDALWAEPPARLFARLLSDTIASKTGRVVLSGAQAFGDPGAKLAGELRSFGIDEASSEAVVQYEAVIARGPGRVYEKRRFEAREPISTVSADTVGPAINRAANKVAADVADWVGR